MMTQAASRRKCHEVPLKAVFLLKPQGRKLHGAQEATLLAAGRGSATSSFRRILGEGLAPELSEAWNEDSELNGIWRRETNGDYKQPEAILSRAVAPT